VACSRAKVGGGTTAGELPGVLDVDARDGWLRLTAVALLAFAALVPGSAGARSAAGPPPGTASPDAEPSVPSASSAPADPAARADPATAADPSPSPDPSAPPNVTAPTDAAAAAGTTPPPAPPPPVAGPVLGAALAPVGLGDVADFGTGVRARIAAVEAVEAEAFLPGEHSGPAVAVTVELSNGSGRVVGLDTVTVDVTDAAGAPASPVTDPARAGLAGDLPSGAAASGVYVFSLPPDRRARATVGVRYAAPAPMALFTGSLGGG
jgi:hypothetical protein